VKEPKNSPSSDSRTRTSIRVYGQEYVVRSAYSSRQIKDIGAYVDKKMREIDNRSPNLTLTRLAVLTSLNIADELFRLKDDYEALLKVIEEEKKSLG